MLQNKNKIHKINQIFFIITLSVSLLKALAKFSKTIFIVDSLFLMEAGVMDTFQQTAWTDSV